MLSLFIWRSIVASGLISTSTSPQYFQWACHIIEWHLRFSRYWSSALEVGERALGLGCYDSNTSATQYDLGPDKWATVWLLKNRRVKLSEHNLFVVLINDEEQYSLWPAGKDAPPGWRATETCGTEEACMRWVDEVWTDMRPASLRAAMAVER